MMAGPPLFPDVVNAVTLYRKQTSLEASCLSATKATVPTSLCRVVVALHLCRAAGFWLRVAF